MENSIIRVAHIIGKWLGGGVESVVMNYYRHIDRNQIQFDFICDEDSTNIPYEEIKKLGGRVILVPPYQKVFKYQKTLKKIFKENKYKIVHSHINTLSIFPLRAAKKAGVPIRIAHSHSTTNKLEKKKNLLKQILRPFSKVYANRYFCCSELAGRWLFGDKEYDKGNVYLLNNAIEIEKFGFNPDIRKKIRKILNINDNTIVFGHIGRFVEQKNHIFLINLFSQIHKLNSNTKLVLVGQGPLKKLIEDKVFELGLTNSVLFTGQLDKTYEIYNAFDMFLFPSLYEGLGMCLIEAQANGLQCIASTNVPLLSRVLRTTKYLSLKYSSKDWANSILESYQNCNRVFDILEFNNKGFNINIEAPKLVDLYQKLVIVK